MKSKIEIENAIDNVLIKLLHINGEVASTAAREKTPGWSSLMHIEIFFALEEEFGVRFDDDSMAFSESRDDLVETVISVISK